MGLMELLGSTPYEVTRTAVDDDVIRPGPPKTTPALHLLKMTSMLYFNKELLLKTPNCFIQFTSIFKSFKN